MNEQLHPEITAYLDKNVKIINQDGGAQVYFPDKNIGGEQVLTLDLGEDGQFHEIEKRMILLHFARIMPLLAESIDVDLVTNSLSNRINAVLMGNTDG